MTLMLAVLVRSEGSPTLGIILCFAAGAFLFYQGFRSYREYRILADTPIMPIRSIAMGLTHARGKATGDDRLTSSLTGASCFYYSVKVEKWVHRGKHSGWDTVSSEMEHRPFYLDDGMAKVAVNPQRAEFDLPPTFCSELGPTSGSNRFVEPSLGVAGPSDQDLRAYLTDRSAHARPAQEAANVPGGSAAAKGMSLGHKLEVVGLSIGGGGLSIDFGAHRYRLTEECLLTERDCIVLGTCVENPSPKDDGDRNLITRGENEKTLLISSKTEQITEKDLRKKALILILTGSFFMIVAALIALHTAKLL
ncbi:MAG: hypothetical protein ABSA59_19320 [Terriglobia bacterium]